MADEYDLESFDSDDGPTAESSDPIATAAAVATDDPKTGLLPLVGGAVLALSALRSLSKGRLRGVLTGVVGAGLVGFALRNRRSRGASDAASDDAFAAARRPGPERGAETDEEVDAEGESGSRIEFTDADDLETRSKPDAETHDEDPRRHTDDESTEVDVSDTATADEAGEATGPDPEQAQPTQTDATEPEATPAEDQPDEGADGDSSDDADGAADDDSGEESD